MHQMLNYVGGMEALEGDQAKKNYFSRKASSMVVLDEASRGIWEMMHVILLRCPAQDKGGE